MATIKDVAKMAGVSTTTVSHVINKTRFVAKETEEAVMQAIKSLKYSPTKPVLWRRIPPKRCGMQCKPSTTPQVLWRVV